MAQHYTRFLEILKNWPVDQPRTIHCFGKYLRDSSSKWFTPDGRVIGNIEDCERRLHSLETLSADYYRQKYPVHVKSVTGMKPEQCREVLVKDYTNNQGFLRKIITKFSPNIPKD